MGNSGKQLCIRETNEPAGQSEKLVSDTVLFDLVLKRTEADA